MFHLGKNFYSIWAGDYGIMLTCMNIVLTFCEEDGRRSFPLILDGICRFARTRKWHVENITSRDAKMSVAKLMDFWRPVGCIAELSRVHTLSPKMFKGTPVVFLNHEPSEARGGASVVGMDHDECVRLAIAELLGSNPAQLGYVPFLIPSRPWNVARQRAFERSCADKSAPFSVFRPHGDATRLQRVPFIRQLRAWLKRLKPPCGILAANDEAAATVVVACSMEGIRIPQDVSVIGIDDDATICENSHPTISSVRPNFAKSAYMAAKLLDRAIRHPDWRGRHVVCPPECVTRRESTHFLLRTDAEVEAAMNMIRSKACTGLTSREVHRMFSCSRRSADERFRAATHLSILEAIHEERLSRMQELLLNPSQDLSAIANLCGYASQNAACKFFRLKTGTTMTAWRRQHLG